MNEAQKTPLPRLIRHHKSGIWLCYVHGPGELPFTLHIEGRRIWAWEGGRLETSQLLTEGLRSGDRIGDWVHNDLPWSPSDGNPCDALHATIDQVEAARAMPQWRP